MARRPWVGYFAGNMKTQSDQRATSQPPPLPPHAQLVQMAMGHWVATVLYTAAKLGLADLLADGSVGADELAAKTKTHPPSLYRLLRTLGHLGLVTQDAQHRFALTPLGAALKKGAPGAARASVLTLASEAWLRGFAQLPYSVQTGKSGFEHLYNMPVFDWLARDPEAISLFSETMVGIHGAEPAAVAKAYDFSGLETIVDVGGATGHLLATILQANPASRGILYDLPHVVREAPAVIAARGLDDRMAIEAGSFFDSVPAFGDAYLLSHIIHDWSEPQCLEILSHCRHAMKPTSRLLIIEMVLPEGNEPHPGKLLDMMMLVGPGGQERTGGEYRDLLAKAGLRMERIVPTESPVSVVDARIA